MKVKAHVTFGRTCTQRHVCTSPRAHAISKLVCSVVKRLNVFSTLLTWKGGKLVQVGNEVPNVDVPTLGKAFEVTQSLLRQRHISAGHDISDGGIITTLLEMAFAGNCGLAVCGYP